MLNNGTSQTAVPYKETAQRAERFFIMILAILNHFVQSLTHSRGSSLYQREPSCNYILATPVSFAAFMTASATTLPTLLSRADTMM